ncbi:carbon-nitrogen hydrolase [Xylona heveae TC161]|uniref:Carbon-nitrogen hydrolase n=1 Tax=Xylona heveae (strain CBS 132557 / TC161) TaxID=1328760 RepID=A0A165GXI5_XYLHT|nr:carbon-nitrogen hydrolase [Xylona heveae TC161]KZF22727.1 carbon-nitrogen hydrolase [Xylona heveae TC161]
MSSQELIKVAVIQLYAEPLKVEHNFNKAANFIRAAAFQGAKLAVLPEYHLTAWVPDRPGFLEATRQWKTYLQKYQALAKECNICIVPGTIVECHEGEDGEERVLWNPAYFIDNKGEILGSYKKKNLWHSERGHLTSSAHSPHEVIETPIGPVGMLICWDLAFPEAFRELIAKGAKIIIIPSFWTLWDSTPAGMEYNKTAEALFIDSSITSRAFENTCAVIFANAGGPSSRGYAGLSQVTVPFIGPLVRLGSGEEGMCVVNLNTAVLEAAEDCYKVREDLSRQDWHYDYRHNRTSHKI